MRNDQTFAADRLLASNPGEAAKQGVAPKGHCNVGDIFDKIKLNTNKKLKKSKSTAGNESVQKSNSSESYTKKTSWKDPQYYNCPQLKLMRNN